MTYIKVSGEKEWNFARDGYMPLSPSILKEFERDVKGVYHVTDIAGLEKLARLQGRRVDIACFTKGSRGIASGLLTDAEALVTIDGKSSIDFTHDIHTKVDRNGIRWLSPRGGISAKVNGIVYQFKVQILKKVINNFEISKADKRSEELFGFGPNLSKLPDDIAVSNWIYDKDGKTKQEFLKYYYTEAKKLIDKQLIDQINKAISWMEKEQFKHDEILVHNFKIVNTKLIRSNIEAKAAVMWKRAFKAGMNKFKVIDQSVVENLG